MRIWYKYLRNFENNLSFIPKDVGFSEHKKSMGGYRAEEGYASKEDFFQVHFLGAHPRLRFYDEYLQRHLSRGEEGLSIGSGRCANEIKLLENGYKITCTDLEEPCRKDRERIFPVLEFAEFDITTSPFQRQVDYVVSLSMFYLFNKEELFKVFKNVADSLRPRGKFVFDVGGGADNRMSYIIDEMICKYETKFIAYLIRSLKKKGCVVTKKHHGFRWRNEEICSIAEMAGFSFVDMKCYDFTTEIKSRSDIIKRLIPDSIAGIFGRYCPYVRMFSFIKK